MYFIKNNDFYFENLIQYVFPSCPQLHSTLLISPLTWTASVQLVLKVNIECPDLWPLLCDPVGPDGGRRGERAALHAGGELPDGERDREELGRYEALVGLHFRPREAQHRLTELQDPAHGAAHEPHQEPREDHRGLSARLLSNICEDPQWGLCLWVLTLLCLCRWCLRPISSQAFISPSRPCSLCTLKVMNF